MFCPEGGAENPEELAACSQCGEALPTAANLSRTASAGRATNGLAVASLVTGIVSLVGNAFCCSAAVIDVVGPILGIVALHQINEQPDVYDGRGLAIAGVATSAAGSCFLGLGSVFSFGLPSLMAAA